MAVPGTNVRLFSSSSFMLSSAPAPDTARVTRVLAVVSRVAGLRSLCSGTALSAVSKSDCVVVLLLVVGWDQWLVVSDEKVPSPVQQGPVLPADWPASWWGCRGRSARTISGRADHRAAAARARSLASLAPMLCTRCAAPPGRSSDGTRVVLHQSLLRSESWLTACGQDAIMGWGVARLFIFFPAFHTLGCYFKFNAPRLVKNQDNYKITKFKKSLSCHYQLSLPSHVTWPDVTCRVTVMRWQTFNCHAQDIFLCRPHQLEY